MVTTQDDVPIKSVLYTSPKRNPTRHSDFFSLRLRALTLLTAAITLRITPVDPVKAARQHKAPGYLIGYRSIADCRPQDQQNLKLALDQFRTELPPIYAVPWRTWDEGEFTNLRPMTRSAEAVAVVSSPNLIKPRN